MDERLVYMGLTQEEFDEKATFVSEYEEIDKKLGDLRFSITNKILNSAIEEMQSILIDEESKYKECKAIVEEYENFDEDNYITNDGIWEHTLEERRGGF